MYRDKLFSEIRDILTELFGVEGGGSRYSCLKKAADTYLGSTAEPDRGERESFDGLAGKIFVIAYPDNVYTDEEYPLETLHKTLKRYFPSIGGIHILPERTMSHGDVWPQDFFAVAGVENAGKIFSALEKSGLIDRDRMITPQYEENRREFLDYTLREVAGTPYEIIRSEVSRILEEAWNSHFNDGGFSQKTRAVVDPRFGLNSHLRVLTENFAVMLDYVVNHLDMDNSYLEEFRRGNNDGEAFLIIYRDRYRQLKADGVLDRTFRPRPFPLFTGMRKYPLTELGGVCSDPESCAAEMNRIFTANSLDPLDHRVIRFMSIYFKVENEQGLTSEERRILRSFEDYCSSAGIDTSSFWVESRIQAKQQAVDFTVLPHMEALMEKLGLDVRYADIFMNDGDHVFGREFYIYTTFSESQVDINPLSEAGFAMIIDDLFHLLSSGSLAMMRLDAIKYLWKEIGKKNFDLEEGNRFIRLIRLLLEAVSPGTLPLDEINSSDPVVYSMMAEGGFAYLFGQVNTVPVAFNEGTLMPLVSLYRTREKLAPSGFVPFVTLSTHDGRSVQGLGVQLGDGHISIEQFYRLKDTIEAEGGKPKFRSVRKGEMEGDTFRKVLTEAGLWENIRDLADLFREDLVENGDLYRLKDLPADESDLLEEMAARLDTDVRSLAGSPAIDYFIQWVVYGKTAYELCCTSRSAFTPFDPEGNCLTEEEEAARLALAQLFVLTQGQDVPAIYFNDLIGLENDRHTFSITGRPRDLNRHKNRLEELNALMNDDPFTVAYTEKLNRILELRCSDKSFRPGKGKFRFIALEDCIFINHPWYGEEHSVILGNILNRAVTVDVHRSMLDEIDQDVLTDQSEGMSFRAEGDVFTFDLEPYGYLYLK